MNDLLTIIYITSNKENEEFEKKIREKMLPVIGDIPLISVSQKSIDFGKNICVGEVGCSYFNMFRQIQIGCENATTPFVVTTEADCLYPPDYFDFVPPDPNTMYRYGNTWILKKWSDLFYKKDWIGGMIMTGREYYLKTIRDTFHNRPKWTMKSMRLEMRHVSIYGKHAKEKFDYYGINSLPAISIKTMNGLGKDTGTMLDVLPVETLPYWGSAKELKKELNL